MKRISTLFLTLMLCLTMMAEAVGSWNVYLAYNNITRIAPGNKKVFVLSSGNLFSYSKADGMVETLDKRSGLCDTGITGIEWNTTTRSLIVTYSNSKIDIIDESGEITSIIDIYEKQINNGSKDINSVCMSGKYAYLGCGFGIVKLNMADCVIADTYMLNKNIASIAITGNTIYALTSSPNTLIKASLNSNLLDPGQWTTVRQEFNVSKLFSCGNDILAGVAEIGIWKLEPSTGDLTMLLQKPYSFASQTGGKLTVGNGTTASVFSSASTIDTYTMPYQLTCFTYERSSNSFWSNDADGKLANYEADADGGLTAKLTGVDPDDGPLVGDAYKLTVNDGTLYVAPGTFYAGVNNTNPGNVLMYENGKWGSFQNNILELTGIIYEDVLCVAVDPFDNDHVFVGGKNGLFEFRNKQFVKDYRVNIDGSPLVIAVDKTSDPRKWGSIHSLVFDKEGKLWVFNSKNTNMICLTREGEWKVFDHSDKITEPYNNYFLDAIMDSRGLIWFCSSYWDNSRLFCYNPQTDKLKRFDNFSNQDGIQYMPYLYSLCEDNKHNVWIGTSYGPFYISADDIEAGNDVFTQHKVPRNDGTNYADYLLANLTVNAIAVDRFNRKWIGTGNNGLFLISNSNNIQLFNYTAQNSPLPSNTITDIKIDELTGRVYIATDKGLCSYMSDVSGSSEIVDSNVYAYPNPLTPEHRGTVTIVGLDSDCDVKILSTAGHLVNEGTTSGGSYEWNACDMSGNRVASGVYMVHITKSDGKSGVVTKIAVVR